MAILGPFDFKGGYSPGYDVSNFPQGKGYATALCSVRVKNGYVTPRWGLDGQIVTNSVSVGMTNNPVLSLKVWYDTANAKNTIVFTCGNALFIMDVTGLDPSTLSTTAGAITGALAAASVNGLTTYDSLNNILVGSANSASSGAVFKVTAYNANAAALGGSPPSADIVKQVNNFMFLSRNLSSTTTQSKVYWSNVNDPETWGVANVLEFNKNDGDPITALGSIGTDLYIFKRNAIGRLSTVTITISGAVTLGPLVTVIRGVGCCGPRALDNLPNGNIVFVSQAGHFYEFDGSSLVDHSRGTYPNLNVFDSGVYSNSQSNLTPHYGLSSCSPDVNTIVKAVRGMNEVWIGFRSSLNSHAIECFAYDFEQNIWQGNMDNEYANSSALNPYCFEVFPWSNYSNALQGVESYEAIIYGTTSSGGVSTGRIVATGGGQSAQTTYAMSDALTPVACNFRWGTIVQLLTPQGEPFIPRSLCFEIDYLAPNSGVSSLSSITVLIGFDSYVPTTTLATITTTFPQRIVLPITFKQDSVGTNIFPTNLSIEWYALGTGSGLASQSNAEMFRFGKFYLSDEVIR